MPTTTQEPAQPPVREVDDAAVDAVFERWAHLTGTDLTGWQVDQFARLFTGWHVRVCLTDPHQRVAMVLRTGSTLLALAVNSHLHADSPHDAFDAALSDCIIGADPLTMIGNLEGGVEDGFVRGITAEVLPLLNQALVLAAPVKDRESIRMLLALQDLPTAHDYQRIPINHGRTL